MDGFLLAAPDGVVRAHDTRATFDDAQQAVTALRDGTATMVVGALPFDPREPAALSVPGRVEHTAGPWRPAAVPELPPVSVLSELPSTGEHLARVAKLVEQLADSRQPLRKVVAARSVLAAAEEPLDAEVVAAQLLTRHPRAHVYAVDLTPAGRAGETLVGATPEVLVSRHGRTVTLHPLAGTLPRLADPDADAVQARDLLASTKNRDEHAFVIDWIADKLRPLCTSLSIPDGPELVQTQQVWHLGTPITGTLRDPAPTALELALLLHPTPAVCGTPTPQALEAIIELEGDRGFYGGAAGWCDGNGDGDWVVAIRCAEIAADGLSLRAFAGGGIVAASEPLIELDETTAKLRTLLDSLNCALPPN
ncbi:isochorismate synthase [Nocardia cyriacigeorgica]|uniref:isochorismate synthase n=1 Tax=Nocardia cyriacigeorgica TaxID=135487 RepID=UPI001893B79F|nr:isochorismate synthase [Nocardia cyriacigeorgica]MBF6495148.1 isochorismate synthase [Nocardia cyriacigeorgica]